MFLLSVITGVCYFYETMGVSFLGTKGQFPEL